MILWERDMKFPYYLARVTCVSVNSSSHTCTCPTGFTGPNCQYNLLQIPLIYTVQLTQNPSDPCRNLTMLIQAQAAT